MIQPAARLFSLPGGIAAAGGRLRLRLPWFARPSVRRGLLLLALFAWGCSAAFAGQTWYVSTLGNDANSGTSSNTPLQHVQTALNQASYGDTVNIQAGVYREQVLLPSSWTATAGAGSPNNMLLIQAWDTNGDGIIETNEMPTISAFQSLTNWTALTNASVWAALTGGAAYQAGTIFWTYWSANDTTNVPFNMIAESDTNVLLPTSWPNFYACNHPMVMPTNMTQGSFQYDYANHILYVWRSDGNVPGPAHPIQAPLLDPSLGAAWGGQGPFEIDPSYVHIKGLKFRYGNNIDNPNEYGPAAIGVAMGAYSILESCDSEWQPWQGGQSYASVVTNCTFANNGGMALGIFGTNEIVTGCTFSNNCFMHYAGGCMSEGTIHLSTNAPLGGLTVAGTIISNNIFLNNWGDAFHGDFASGTPSNLCIIANNFFYGTNISSVCSCITGISAGIDLEISSFYGIYDNIMMLAGEGIYLDGSQGNRVINNTLAATLVLNPEPYRGGGPFLAINNIVANNIFVMLYDQANIGWCQDSTNPAATPYGAVCYNNVFTNNLCWNFLPATNLDLGAPWLNLVLPPYTNGPLHITNVVAWAQQAAGTDKPSQNSGNLIANPLFFNYSNTTNPANPNYYTLNWDSPARNAGGAANYGVTTDFLGNPRGPVSDLGAYQSDLLFADNFAHTGTLSPWVDESGTWSLTAGTLNGQNAASGPGIVYLTNNWTDYFVQANIQFGNIAGYGAGLSARLNPATGARYAAYVYPEDSPVVSGGRPLVKLIKFQSWTNWSYLGGSNQPIAAANLNAVGTSWHTLQLAVQGKQLTVYFDGSNVLSAADAETSTYSSGGVGVDMSTLFPAYTYSVSNLGVEAFSPWVANSGEWAVTGGSLQGTNALGGNYGNAYLTNIWTNYSFQCGIQFSTINAYGGGLAGRLNPATGTRYAAYLYPEGSPIATNGVPMLKLVKFQSWTNFGYQGVSNAPLGQVALSGVGTNWHTLALSFQGTSIAVSLDGNLELSAADAESTTYPTGAIGMEAYYGQVPYTFSVTNVTVNLSAGSQSKPPPPSNLRMQITP